MLVYVPLAGVGVAASLPVITVVSGVLPRPNPNQPASDIAKLILAPPGPVIAEFRVVASPVDWNDAVKKTPWGQRTCTFEVAVSVPVTAVSVPKSILVTEITQAETGVMTTLALNVPTTEAAFAGPARDASAESMSPHAKRELEIQEAICRD